MKYYEIMGGIQVPASAEETALIERIEENGALPKKSLNERDRELARKLVSRGILNRVAIEEETNFVLNGLKDLWRE